MNYNKKSVEDIDVFGKKVLVRCDFNVPLDAEMNITDENRIIGAMPTIKYLIEHNAILILCSHPVSYTHLDVYKRQVIRRVYK